MRAFFDLPPGLFSDETTFATPGRWERGSNVRFWLGRPQVIGGWSAAVNDTLGGTCRNAFAWADNTGNINLAFGTNATLEVMVGGTLYDVTPSGLSAGSVDGAGGPGYGTGGYDTGTYGESSATEWYARTWSLQNYGEFLLASPRGGTLYVWDNDTGNLATEVTAAPDNIQAMLVTPERQVLAFGCNEEVSTTFNPMCIRGSKIEDYTDWTTGAAADDAFEHILEGGGSRIVAARMIGSLVLVLTDTGAWLGQYIGSAGQAYRFDLVATNCGCLGPNAVTVVNQVAYWMTPDLQPYRMVLGSPPEPIVCPIRNDFADNMVISQSEKLIACPVGKFSEIWFHYPDGRDGVENSRYIALGQDGAWFQGELARTCAIDAGPTQYPLMVDPDGQPYWHENGESANGSALSWEIKSSSQYLGDADRMFLVRGVWPDFESQTGAISLTVEMRDYPQGTARSNGPYSLAANATKKDFMVQGRIAALTFSGSSAPAYVRMGRPSLDIVATGQQ